MGRPRNPDSLLNYFPEKEMVEVLKKYKDTKSEKYFEILEPKLVAVINGMINKEFSYNTYVKSNRDIVISECLFAILQSYQRFDPEKGRLFAYTNRIIKNTLLKCYNKNIRKNSKESTYTDINASVDTGNDMDVDNIFNLQIIADNELVDDSYEVKNSFENVQTRNIILDSDTTIHIVYNYITYIKEAVEYFMSNEKLDILINDIKYDSNIGFDFTKYHSTFTDDKMFYSNLLENIDYTLNSVVNWIRCYYHDVIDKEPVSFDGKLSNRVINSVKRFIINSFNVTLGNKINSEELINFMKFIATKRYLSYGNDK